MTTPKIKMTLLIMLCSFVTRSQTFVLNGSTYIGKTQKEIEKINVASNSKFFTKEKSGPIISIVYIDSLNGLTNHFIFARKGLFRIGPWKCFSYLVNVHDKSQYEKIKADLQTKWEDIIVDKHRAVQVSNSKKYLWHYYSSDKSNLNQFIIEKYHDVRNYR